MHDFARALVGGVCIGGATVAYLYLFGRILGVSGMIGQALNPNLVSKTPAVYFFIGLLTTSYLFASYLTQAPIDLSASKWQIIVGGLLVGFGTRMGSGCTSGHGVCGLSRWSARSLVAVCTFMAAGFATVYVLRHI